MHIQISRLQLHQMTTTIPCSTMSPLYKDTVHSGQCNVCICEWLSTSISIYCNEILVYALSQIAVFCKQQYKYSIILFKMSAFHCDMCTNAKLMFFCGNYFHSNCHHNDDILITHWCRNYMVQVLKTVDNSNSTSHTIIFCALACNFCVNKLHTMTTLCHWKLEVC